MLDDGDVAPGRRQAATHRRLDAGRRRADGRRPARAVACIAHRGLPPSTLRDVCAGNVRCTRQQTVRPGPGVCRQPNTAAYIDATQPASSTSPGDGGGGGAGDGPSRLQFLLEVGAGERAHVPGQNAPDAPVSVGRRDECTAASARGGGTCSGATTHSPTPRRAASRLAASCTGYALNKRSLESPCCRRLALDAPPRCVAPPVLAMSLGGGATRVHRSRSRFDCCETTQHSRFCGRVNPSLAASGPNTTFFPTARRLSRFLAGNWPHADAH
jgi:hypothetical protein